MRYWERKEKLFKYTDGARQFFPLAKEQLEIISRIVHKYNPRIKHFLDLGCGVGFLGSFIYELYPDSAGVFLDISGEMIQKEKKRNMPDVSEFMEQDFGDSKWTSSLKSIRDFDLIISGYSIHHIDNERKKRLYICRPNS